MRVTSHRPDAGSVPALGLISILLWIAVNARGGIHCFQLPLHQVGLPQGQGEAGQEQNLVYVRKRTGRRREHEAAVIINPGDATVVTFLSSCQGANNLK